MLLLIADVWEGALRGALKGALIGGACGLLAGLVLLLLPRKPCPRCKKPLPRLLFGQAKACPKCGCKLNAKGKPADKE